MKEPKKRRRIRTKGQEMRRRKEKKLPGGDKEDEQVKAVRGRGNQSTGKKKEKIRKS